MLSNFSSLTSSSSSVSSSLDRSTLFINIPTNKQTKLIINTERNKIKKVHFEPLPMPHIIAARKRIEVIIRVDVLQFLRRSCNQNIEKVHRSNNKKEVKNKIKTKIFVKRQKNYKPAFVHKVEKKEHRLRHGSKQLKPPLTMVSSLV